MRYEQEMNPRAGDEVQTWFCKDCEEWHTGSVIGGPLVLLAESPPLKSLRELQSERDEQEAA